MGIRYFANAPATNLTVAVSPSATTIIVDSVTGLPVNYPFTLILDRGTANEEVVSCTGAAGTTLTVTRGYDSTTAFSHSTGATVEHGISALDPREANAHVNATSATHGVSGDLVGTTDAQVVTNKDLTTGNTFPFSAAWTPYTPTWTNLTVGNGTNNSAYLQIGKIVIVRVKFTLGSTSAVTGQVQASLPVNSVVGHAGMFGALYFDTSATTRNSGFAIMTNNNVLTFRTNSDTVTGATAPFTWATGDTLGTTGIYEVA